MNQNNSVEISVVAPVFNEINNLDEFIKRTEAVLNTIQKTYEIILIDDFSTDGTREKILDLCKKNKNFKSIFL